MSIKVTKRQDGRFFYNMVIGRKANGKYERKPIYGQTEKEVLDQYIDIKFKLNKGLYTVDDKVTFSQYAETWLERYKAGVGTSTHKMYRAALTKHINPLMGHKKVAELRPLDLQNVFAAMIENGLGKKTVKTVKSVCSQIMDTAVDNEIAVKNPFARMKIPKKLREKKREPLTEQQRELVEATWQQHRMGLPAILSMYSGLRKNELTALRWSDIDLDKKIISVTKATHYKKDGNTPYIGLPKSEASISEVTIPDMIVDVLKPMTRKKGLICPSAKGELMSEAAYKRAWKSYQHFLNLEMGGKVASRSRDKIQVVEPFTMHQLRHTFATILYEAGVDVKTASKLMRHADEETTLRIYTSLTKKKEQLSINSLNEALKDRSLKKETD